MITLSELPRIMHNPALGSVVLYSFVQGWEEEAQDLSKDGVPLPLLFLPFPLVLHEPTAKILASTQRRSGLVGLTEGDGKLKSDVYSFQDRVLAFQELSMESMVMALAVGLLILNPQSGLLISGSPAVPQNSIPGRVRLLVNAARCLGRLCQGYSLESLSLHFRVSF